MTNGRNIPVSSPEISEEDVEMVSECLKSGWISSSGDYVSEFESSFAKYLGVKYGVTTNSGTTALHLILESLGIGKNDEVIIPTFTMIASANAVTYTNASIKLVDSNPEDWNMNVDQVRDSITKKTKAIMPVHIYGYPCDMDEIMEIGEENNISVIEDAAEAHGAKYRGRMIGSIGSVSAFSFYANKIITTGEGGMALTNDKQLATMMKWLRAHAFGREGKHFWHERLGFGYRMSALQAALGVSQLKRIEKFVKRRIENAKHYNDLLANLEGKFLNLPPASNERRNVYWMYSITLRDPKFRDNLMAYLSSFGIETRTFFYPIHRQPFYASRFKTQKFPVADLISASGINLPSGNTLKDDDIDFICGKILEFFRTRK